MAEKGPEKESKPEKKPFVAPTLEKHGPLYLLSASVWAAKPMIP